MTRSQRNGHLAPCQDAHLDLSQQRCFPGATSLVLPTTADEQVAHFSPASPAFNKARTERFMRRAIELGRKGMLAGDGGPFGAVVAKGDEIIGEGWNRVVAGNDPTAHGEVMAIRDACHQARDFTLKGCDLYTSGEPCPMCLSAIYWARLDRVFYGFSIRDAAAIGFDDQFIYEQLTRLPEQRTIPQDQVLGEEALEILRVYAANPDRVKY